MPVYMVHGFRWDRVKIRHHIILNNVDDGMPEYIMTPSSTKAILDSLAVKYPEIMSAVPKIHFLEQYDPADTSSSAQSQPFAYVCDAVVKGELSINVETARAAGMAATQWQAFADLRDELVGPDVALTWYAVYNGDEERATEMSEDDPRPAVCSCLQHNGIAELTHE